MTHSSGHWNEGLDAAAVKSPELDLFFKHFKRHYLTNNIAWPKFVFFKQLNGFNVFYVGCTGYGCTGRLGMQLANQAC